MSRGAAKEGQLFKWWRHMKMVIAGKQYWNIVSGRYRASPIEPSQEVSLAYNVRFQNTL